MPISIFMEQQVKAMSVIQDLLEKPQGIFKYSTNGGDEFKEISKALLDPLAKEYSVLEELYTDGLDATQVFGQAKLVIDGVREKLLFEKIPEFKEKYAVQEGEEEDEEDINEDMDDEENEEEEEEDEEDQDEDEEDEAENDEVDVSDAESEATLNNLEENESDAETNVESDSEPLHKKDAFGLNDGFFDIDEFKKQIVALEDDDPIPDDGEEVDYFASLSEDEDEEEEMDYYDDFYDKPGKKTSEKKVPEELPEELNEEEYDDAVGGAMHDLFADEEEEEEEEEVKKDSKGSKLSSFERQQQKIQEEIAELEKELVADKKWTMKGEISAKQRPQDSLLEDEESAALEFDRTSKPVPVITDEVTESIEDLIRRRIKNDEFDDLPKRIIRDVSKFHNKQKFELSDAKSSKSLADLYEDDYNNVDAQQQEVSDEIQNQHDEITELYTKLNHHLDSLCSAHYVPKPHEFKSMEIKVTDTSAASIRMEDAQPIHVGSETTLAPQEIYKLGDDKPKANGALGRSTVQLKSGLSYSKDELSREDKQRLRRATKRKKSKHFEAKREQEQAQDTGNDRKRQKSDVVNTLTNAKNVTVIGNRGEKRDVHGHLKKAQVSQGSSNFKL